MPLTPEDVANKQFTSTRLKPGYDETEVDEFLDEVEAELSRLYRENDELRSRLSTVAAGSRGPAEAPDTAALVQERENLAREREAIAREKEGLSREKEGLSREKDGLKRDNDELRTQLAALQRELAEARNRPAPAAPAAAPAAPAAVPQSAESATGILALAQRTADEHIAEARTQADRIISEARNRAEQLKREADDKHRQTIGALDTERVGLEQKVEKLRAFEREYRARLKSYLENQLRELDSAAAAAPAANRPTQGGPAGTPAVSGSSGPTPSGSTAAPTGGGSSSPGGAPRSPFSPGTPVGGQAPSGPPQQAGGAGSSDDSPS